VGADVYAEDGIALYEENCPQIGLDGDGVDRVARLGGERVDRVDTQTRVEDNR